MSTYIEAESSFLEMTTQQFMDYAPRLAVEAIEHGWTEVTFYPDGYIVPSPCGCCETKFRHPPGWYGIRPGESGPKVWAWICSPSGEIVYWNLGAISPLNVSH